jgi:hypothetical protein
VVAGEAKMSLEGFTKPGHNLRKDVEKSKKFGAGVHIVVSACIIYFRLNIKMKYANLCENMDLTQVFRVDSCGTNMRIDA